MMVQSGGYTRGGGCNRDSVILAVAGVLVAVGVLVAGCLLVVLDMNIRV